MAEEKTSISTPSAADSNKDEFRTPLLFDSSERHSDEDKVSIQGLERALAENSRAQTEVLELFKSFYGETEALAWFKRVKANYPQYSDDNRPIFKTLSDLEHNGRRLQNDLVLAKKRAEYSSMSLEDLTDTVMKMEARLLKAEITLKQQSNNLAGKHLLFVGGYTYNPKDKTHTFGTHCTSIDLESGEQVQLCELHTARAYSAVVAIGRRVYVAGGLINHQDGWTKAFEVYDYVLERWDILPDMPEPLSHIKGCSHGSNVIVWGTDRSSRTFAVRMYDTSQRTWENIPSPPVAYSLFVYIGNCLYSGTGLDMSYFDLDHPNPRWQGKQEQENSKIHNSLRCLLENVPISDPASVLSNGTELAIPGNSCSGGSTANFWICNAKTGLFSTLQGDWDRDKKMVAFANNVAVLVPSKLSQLLCILVLSSQAQKFVVNDHISTGHPSAAIVDLKMGVTNDDESGEGSPS